ncbi:phage major capsid protein [Aquitalea aquatilis]|uniref:phage major capsid protein n=1 Tax=Aquitalea aquatilis TaxID=1537400 RepID=UPI0010BD24C2|nr:phage major capsid protein [Aquitalea aquatilis]
MKLQALRVKRAEIANKMKALVNADGAWNQDRQAEFGAMQTEVEQIDNQINAIQAALAIQEGLAANDGETHRLRGISVENAAEMRRDLLVAFLRGGESGVQALQQQPRFSNVQTIADPTTGGYLVPSEMFNAILQAMKLWGGMREVATVVATQGGNPLSFPTADATAEEGEILAEGIPSNPGGTAFGQATLNAFKYSSKTVAISVELLQDSAFDIESYVVNLLGLRLGRVTNRHFTVGTGVGQPKGIITAAQVGKVGAAGQVASILYDDLVDLEHSIDPVYRNSAKWMLHDSMLRQIKKLKDSMGRPLWLPGLEVKAPDTILGYPFQINQHMAAPAANAKSLSFGDHSKYLIRDVMNTVMYRNTDSKYNELGLVGFHALSRHDGNMLDIGGAVKTFQQAAA